LLADSYRAVYACRPKIFQRLRLYNV